VRYLLPFEVIKRPIELSTGKDHVTVTISYERLLELIRHLLSQVVVDEEWYLAQYPDVAEAIAQGKTTSATQHFIDNGYFENRLPFLISVNERWYFTNYPDVAASVRKGAEPSAQAHFIRSGYREGRLPYPIANDSGKPRA
jgi:hypothetical protein